MNEEDLKQRLGEAEATIDALRRQEVDAVVGSDRVMVLRLREAEQKLRESEQRFRVLVETTAQAVWETDAAGRVVQESATWLQYTGQKKGGSLGDGWLQAFHPDDRDEMREKWREAVDSQRTLDAECRLHGPGDTWRWTHVRAAPIRESADGPVTKWVGMNSDITRRKTAEALLEQARDRAESASEARGEFVANMSHEIRTPMTAILGYADILGNRLDDPDDLECIETIRSNGRFLLQIINDILDLSKIDAGQIPIQRKDVSVAELIIEILQLMEVPAKENRLSLQVEFATRLPETIETDPLRLRQILVNLLGNAIKFTTEGEVRLIARFDSERNRIEFDVVDTGIGIHPAEREHLFEPFMQSDASSTRAAGGTGLGLTISRQLARMLGGDIAVHSRLGEGSTFMLSIDCGSHGQLREMQRELENVSPVDAKTSDTPQLRGRILLVDDRREIRFLAEHLITDAGASVITASGGEEALALIEEDRTGEATVDVILMDVQMPVMDGLEATRRLRQKGFDRPVVALTASAMQKDRDRCFAAGCNDFISKPIDRDILLGKLSHWIEQSRNVASAKTPSDG